MKSAVTLMELRQARRQLPEPVGLVPTMGYLHVGHLSLVRAARRECASVIATIFVNPTQFGPDEDLASYPQDIPRDLSLLEHEQVDLVWLPTPEVMYPPAFQTWVSVEKLSLPLEGAMRPGHFRGVTTVVAKLFNAAQPHKAYFGQKDAQQAAVIRQMVADLDYPTQVVICPTLREPDGLAMSSRNAYLNPAERQAATILYRALSATRQFFDQGERHPAHLRQTMSDLIISESLAHLQYASCADMITLQELENEITGKALLSLAVFLGKTRLIDNMVIGE